MRIVTESPEMADVPGAVKTVVTVTDVPCGMCFTTAFYDVEDKLLRQDQYVDAFRAYDAATGDASLYRPPA